MKFSKNHLSNIGASLESQLCDLKKKQFVERSKLIASHRDELVDITSEVQGLPLSKKNMVKNIKIKFKMPFLLISP